MSPRVAAGVSGDRGLHFPTAAFPLTVRLLESAPVPTGGRAAHSPRARSPPPRACSLRRADGLEAEAPDAALESGLRCAARAVCRVPCPTLARLRAGPRPLGPPACARCALTSQPRRPPSCVSGARGPGSHAAPPGGPPPEAVPGLGSQRAFGGARPADPGGAVGSLFLEAGSAQDWGGPAGRRVTISRGGWRRLGPLLALPGGRRPVAPHVCARAFALFYKLGYLLSYC